MNILAIGCHPDDLEISCGGTLALYARQGHAVTMLHLANGNMGHVVIMPDELRRIRNAEAERAGEILGAREVLTLDIPDLKVDSHNPLYTSALVAVIRRVQPDVIIAHAPEDYMRDHVEAGQMAFDASFSASVPHFESQAAQPEAAKITPLYYMETAAGVNFIPVEYVDITTVIEAKLQAVACHESQVKWLYDHDGIDFVEFVRTISKFRGQQCGAGYAEGFRPCLTWPRLSARRWLP